MKKDIHPNYDILTVELTDGSTFETRSTYEGDVLKLDIDVKTHPAWTGGTQRIREDGRVAKFNKRFSNFGLK
ncbi:50S ribosomal protein L31 [Sneathiella glossodoripedis]|uniref:50S ribosomal protein L31 n=1 Tax=Sneathiella glossodoripedis TaxID=418853 RepID=UPI000472C93B|nr:50S ribosomal protein L31 [Sneathiella glossodoripedis]